MTSKAGAIVLVLLLGLAGCSSTKSSKEIGDAADRETASGVTAVDDLAPDGSGLLGGRRSGRVSGGDVSGDPGSTAVDADPAGVPAAPSLPKGKPLKIGLMFSSDANTVLEAIGANTRTADLRKVQDAVLAYINKTGGLAGHPLQAAYHDVRSTDSPAVISQRACAQWTEDDNVFLALPSASVQDNSVMRTCLAKKGVPAMYANFYTTTSETDFRATPLWFEPHSLSLESWARTYATGLAKQGFFKGAKIGLVYDETPAFTRTAEQVLIPMMKRLGANIVSTAKSRIYGASDLGPGSSQMSNVVLRFRGAGVTKVMFYEVWQGWFLFAQNAQSQDYKPIYGFSGQNAMQIMIETGLVPLEQLVGSKLVGWNPGADLGPPRAGQWARVALCNKIFKDAGLVINDQGTQAHHGTLAACGALLALQDGARLAPRPLTQASLRQGLEALGTKLQLANMPSSRFGDDRHYGAAAWRPGSYVASCECYRYTAPATSITP